jgi:guanine nucleotide-binding protein G(i) subunit alpha
MGICAGKQVSVKDTETNKAINKALMEERKRLDNEVKLLLLGAGESGKSTIAKQMKIIHLNGFSDDERNSYKSIIYNNTVGSMRVLVAAARELGIELGADNQKAAERMSGSDEYFTGTLTAEIAEDIAALWKDPGIKETYARSAEFQLNDSAGYYFDEVTRLSAPDYMPTEQDVLRSRAKTTGIIETEFQIEGTNFQVVDVGGQRSERKKWMHCFQDVTYVFPDRALPKSKVAAPLASKH